MILSRKDIQQILKGEVGEVTVSACPPELGDLFWLRASARSLPACQGRVVDVWPLEQGGWSVLFKRAAPKAAKEPPKLKLSQQQRKALFGGGFPHIGGTLPCPVKAGEVVQLSARVALHIARVDVQRGRWKLMYELRDGRDPSRNLRRTPPAHKEGGENEHPTPAALRDAAEQSAYTASLRGLVAECGEAPPKVWLDARTKAVLEFDHQRRLAEHAEKLRDRSKAKTRRKKAA